MSKSLIFSGIKDNWYLVAIVAALLATSLWGATRKEVVAADGTLVLASGEITAAPGGRGKSAVQSRWVSPTRDAKVRADIENYHKELGVNRSSDETPANLFRLANLYYSNLQDYEKASLYYEDLIQSFPDYAGLNTVYPNLVVCYQRQANLALERSTYKRMLDYFPADSQEHLYASVHLGIATYEE